MAFTSDVLTIERDGHVATLWLDNPERRNAFGPAIWDDLPRAMQELNDDAQVRAVVIAAKGTAFTVGLDLKATGFGQMGGPADEGSDAGRRLRTYHELKRLQASITAVADCPKPVVVAVHGWCLGAGVDLITACDVRLAAADATFSVRETRVAIVADVGTLQRLPKVIAPGHAAELVYTGKDIDAARAREIGLVNDVHADHDAVVQAARQMAADIAANSPMAVQGSKAVMRAGDEMTVAQGLDFVALWNASFAQSNDLVEAMTAFMQKRPPTFTGE